MDLNNKIVLVTGSSRGIGAACAKAFAEKGARVVIHYHQNKAGAEKTKKACGADWAIQANLENLADCQKLIQTAVAKYGRIDVLVNNAGISTRHMDVLANMEKKWQTMMDVNLRAPFFLSQYTRPHMPTGGCIVNVSSIRAYKPKNALSPYGTTKAGINYVTKALARDFAPDVRVNAVAPGYVRTEMLEKFYGEKIADLEKETPIGRLIQPVEIAHAVIFLAENDAVTGHTLVVDGGYLVG